MGSHTPAAGPSSVTDYTKQENDSHTLTEGSDTGSTCQNENCKMQIHSVKLEV